jgi:ribosome-binding protein aMBF1 (putative translation factor)
MAIATIDKYREVIIKYIKANPMTIQTLSHEIKINASTLSEFIQGKRIPQFKSLVLIENWCEKIGMGKE